MCNATLYMLDPWKSLRQDYCLALQSHNSLLGNQSKWMCEARSAEVHEQQRPPVSNSVGESLRSSRFSDETGHFFNCVSWQKKKKMPLVCLTCFHLLMSHKNELAWAIYRVPPTLGRLVAAVVGGTQKTCWHAEQSVRSHIWQLSTWAGSSCPHFVSQRGRQRRRRQNIHARILLNYVAIKQLWRISREEKHRTVPQCWVFLIVRKWEEPSRTIRDGVRALNLCLWPEYK